MKKECGWMGAQRPSSHIPFSLGWGGLVAKQADEDNEKALLMHAGRFL